MSSSLPSLTDYKKLSLMEQIQNINLEPDRTVKRKLDYFYTPYGSQNETREQFMRFEEIQRKHSSWIRLKSNILHED